MFLICETTIERILIFKILLELNLLIRTARNSSIVDKICGLSRKNTKSYL